MIKPPSNIQEELVTGVRRRALTKPREDKEINPALIHRIKTYIGDTSNGPIVDRLSYHESKKGRIERLGTFVIPKKTDTKMEVIIATLKVMGYTSKSIAEESVRLFGIQLTEDNVNKGYKKVLWSKYKQDKFLNRIFKYDETDR